MEVKLYVLNGEKLTVKEIANKTGMKYNTVYKRIERGSIAEGGVDVSHLFAPKTKNYLFNGKEVTPEYLAELLSIKSSTFDILARKEGVKPGQDISEVMDRYRKKRRRYVYEGRFTSVKEISKITGINYNTLTVAFYKNGLSAGDEVSHFIKQYTWTPSVNYGVKYAFKDKRLTIREIADLTGNTYKRAADLVARYRDLKNDPDRDLSPYFEKKPGED